MELDGAAVSGVNGLPQQLWWGAAPTVAELQARIARFVAGYDGGGAASEHTGRYRFAAWYEQREEVGAQWAASPVVTADEPPCLAFLYAGQGAQYAGMASELWTHWPWFRSGLERLFASSARRPEAEWSDVLLGRGSTEGLIDQTAFTQPLVYALEIMLTRVWARWGVRPAAVMGHSLGEFAAACAAGVFSELQGMRLVTERGRVMQRLPRNGKYVLVTGEFADIAALVGPHRATTAVAGINAPNLTVISGLATNVDRIVAQCRDLGMSARELPVSLPFHSPLMDPILEEFERFCRDLRFRPPSVPWISGVTGEALARDFTPDPAYWRGQIREPVRFWAAIHTLANRGRTAFLELGPGHQVLSMGRAAIDADEHLWLACLDRKQSSRRSLLESALALWRAGIDVDLARACRDCLPAA